MTTPGASTPDSSRFGGKIVLLGRPCDNTSTAANVLTDAGINLAAVILADPEFSPGQDPAAHGPCPLYRAPSPQRTRRLLEHLQPDLVIAACYPWRLSHRARSAARCGVLNIHPSPLPRGRGPDPVFWAYRNGERDTGVTVHLMDDGLDSGPILTQQRVVVPEDTDADTLERHLFGLGATMTAGLVSNVLSGDASFFPQDDTTATYQAAPSAQDWIISPLLPAAWAWRFARGVEPLHGPLMVQTEGKLVPVRRAISWSEHGSPPDELPVGAIPVRFRPGWVVFEE
jgi:methionyl-tRNA formyltransferase